MTDSRRDTPFASNMIFHEKIYLFQHLLLRAIHLKHPVDSVVRTFHHREHRGYNRENNRYSVPRLVEGVEQFVIALRALRVLYWLESFTTENTEGTEKIIDILSRDWWRALNSSSSPSVLSVDSVVRTFHHGEHRGHRGDNRKRPANPILTTVTRARVAQGLRAPASIPSGVAARVRLSSSKAGDG